MTAMCRATTSTDLWHRSPCSRKATTLNGFCKQHDPDVRQAKEDAERERTAPLRAAERAQYAASVALTAYRARMDTGLRMAESWELRERSRDFAADLVELRRLLLDLDACQAKVAQCRAELKAL